MYFVKCCFLLLCLGISGVLLREISDAFHDANICSDLKINPPQKLFQISYGDIDLKPGDCMTNTQVFNQPNITFDVQPGYYYTLFMLDPDEDELEPGQYVYWLVANTKSSDVKSVRNNAPYRPPPTPYGDGVKPHRYTFLLYEHQKRVKVPSRFVGKQRESFKVGDIARKNDIGDPKYGNYFYGVHYEDSDEDSSEIL